jgi:tripartite-type tricarboxylate transporter receptor subunit TctC
MKLHNFLIATLACSALAHVAPAAGADAAKDYPSRPIRLIVPNAPGSSNDTLGRIVAVKLGDVIGQQIVIDNRAGAGGTLGMELAKTANPDGYTLLSAPTGAMTVAPLLHKTLPFDPLHDYAFVSLFAVTPNVLTVHPSIPAKSVRELIDYCKAKQGQVNMASAGPGSQSHLSGAYLMQAGDFQSLHVPYKGGGPSVAAVIAGESNWTLTPAPAVMSHVNSGRLRALGHSLPQRSALLGSIPPIAETLPGFDYSGWQGIVVPRGTPAPIIEKLRTALIKAVNLPEVKSALATQATEVLTNTPAEFRKVVLDSIEKNTRVVKAVGLRTE